MTGNGGLYKQPKSAFWWMRYSLRGKQYRESTRVPIDSKNSEREAEKVLKHRLMEVGADLIGARKFITPKNERILVGQILDELVDDLKLRDKYSKPTASHLKQIREAFGLEPAIAITEADLRRYIQKMKDQGKAKATINRRTQLLGQAFNLAGARVGGGPKILKLSEADNVRRGFLDPEDFEHFVSFLPEDLQDYTRWAYRTGWRKGTMSRLEWSMFDFRARTVDVPGSTTKNGEPLKLPLRGLLGEIAARRWEKRIFKRPDGTSVISKLVFYREAPFLGEPVQDFDKAWLGACRRSGLEPFLFHDLRRSAVRNFRRAGVDETVAMTITGHKTSAVFRRYDIRDNRDLEAAVDHVERFIERGKVVPFGPVENSRYASGMLEVGAKESK